MTTSSTIASDAKSIPGSRGSNPPSGSGQLAGWADSACGTAAGAESGPAVCGAIATDTIAGAAGSAKRPAADREASDGAVTNCGVGAGSGAAAAAVLAGFLRPALRLAFVVTVDVDAVEARVRAVGLALPAAGTTDAATPVWGRVLVGAGAELGAATPVWGRACAEFKVAVELTTVPAGSMGRETVMAVMTGAWPALAVTTSAAAAAGAASGAGATAGVMGAPNSGAATGGRAGAGRRCTNGAWAAARGGEAGSSRQGVADGSAMTAISHKNPGVKIRTALSSRAVKRGQGRRCTMRAREHAAASPQYGKTPGATTGYGGSRGRWPGSTTCTRGGVAGKRPQPSRCGESRALLNPELAETESSTHLSKSSLVCMKSTACELFQMS